jgi:hypothetical protein
MGPLRVKGSRQPVPVFAATEAADDATSGLREAREAG